MVFIFGLHCRAAVMPLVCACVCFCRSLRLFCASAACFSCIVDFGVAVPFSVVVLFCCSVASLFCGAAALLLCCFYVAA